jgi:7,8-dihydropterin-6-yl-methyl-4-(beta-D-ribofuranosyl)aminobenzene 5'-phosphate synthase
MSENENPEKIKLTIIYDNYIFNRELKTEWGFSCLIKGLEKTILFDTGGNGEILISNMKRLNINPKAIDVVFISHDHWDHTGGLRDFLGYNHKVDVYVLSSFSDELKNSVVNYKANLIENDKLNKICTNVYSTGMQGTYINEQSIIIESKSGLIIITGCAHPGIVEIVRSVKEKLEKNIYMVFGGFHLGGTPDTELQEIIEQFRNLEVEKVGPCHCSGERCRQLFLEEYKQDFIDIGVGKELMIK